MYNYVYCIYMYIHVIQELASKSNDLCDLYTGPAVVMKLDVVDVSIFASC